MRRSVLVLGVVVALGGTAACGERPADDDQQAAAEETPQVALACSFSGPPDALLERPSPLDSVLIDLGGAEAKLCYGRPSARGREMVGGIDPYGAPWRMGANEPTTLHLGFAADLGGVALEPGSYALYAIPDAEEWTIVVNGNPDRWGIPIDDEVRAADIGEITVRPTPLEEHVETLTFRFVPESDTEGALVFEWEKRTFEIPLTRR